MIIKEKSIKTNKHMERVLRYVLSKGLDGTGVILRRFISNDRPFEAMLELAEENLEETSIVMEKRIANFLDQYYANDLNRNIKRKNGVKYYHSIISFHKDDHLQREQLLKTARRFAKERYPNSQLIVVPHYDRDHVHLHAIGSAVEYGTGEVRRMSKAEFSNMKQRMEQWQDKELGLIHSRVNHKKKDKQLLKDVEYQLRLRGKLSEKQKLQMKLQEVYNESKTVDDFYRNISPAGLSPYIRGGKIAGLDGAKRRYRFKTLGFSQERIADIENHVRTQDRLRELKLMHEQERDERAIDQSR